MTPIIISAAAILLLIIVIYNHYTIYADMYRLPEWISGVGFVSSIVIACIAIYVAFIYAGRRFVL